MGKPRFWGRCQHCAEDGDPSVRAFDTFIKRRNWWRWHTERTTHTWPWRPSPEDTKFGTPRMTEQEAQAAADADLTDAEQYKPPRAKPTNYWPHVTRDDESP